MADAYALKLTGPGLEIARDLDQELAFRIVAVLMGKPSEPEENLSESRIPPKPSTRKRARKYARPVSRPLDGGGPPEERSTRKAGRPRAGRSRKGPTQRILDMKTAGWFKGPKTLQEILAELSRRGSHHKRTDLTRLMQTLIRRGDLVREKVKSANGGREVWAYSAD